MKITAHFIVLALFITASEAAFADTIEIKFSANHYELLMPSSIKKTIRKLNPSFVTWETKDYLPRLLVDFSKPDSKQAPFALILDINNDRKMDLVVDGHDKKHSLTIAIISKPSGYYAKIVNESALINPKEEIDCENGITTSGLTHFLWPNKILSKRNKWLFGLSYVQLSDCHNNPINDPGFLQFKFKNGKFYESYNPG